MCFSMLLSLVAPLVGAWVEIIFQSVPRPFYDVAPLVGAWVEIGAWSDCCHCSAVAPLVGAWVEILHGSYHCSRKTVAPLVGAWVEIEEQDAINRETKSLPLWERGLKYVVDGKKMVRTSRSPCGSVG